MRMLIALHPPILVGIVSASLSLFYIIFAILACVMVFDTVARYKEYAFMCTVTDSDKLESMARYMKSSWCTRTVAMVAYPPSRDLYHSMGYKFYHILPDNFHKRVITARFWLSLLGYTIYHLLAMHP